VRADLEADELKLSDGRVEENYTSFLQVANEQGRPLLIRIRFMILVKCGVVNVLELESSL
jgi:hypothetical protein